jgi:hypothetical protein
MSGLDTARLAVVDDKASDIIVIDRDLCRAGVSSGANLPVPAWGREGLKTAMVPFRRPTLDEINQRRFSGGPAH